MAEYSAEPYTDRLGRHAWQLLCSSLGGRWHDRTSRAAELTAFNSDVVHSPPAPAKIILAKISRKGTYA